MLRDAAVPFEILEKIKYFLQDIVISKTISMTIKYSKILEIVTYILSLPPLAFTVSLLSFYFKAANTLGYYPTYNNPDPKLLSFYEPYAQFIHYSGEITVYSLYPWLFCISLCSYIAGVKLRMVITGAVIYLSAFLIFFTEITEWFAD